jgi:hypothetical protein
MFGKRRCRKSLFELHDCLARGHFGGDTIANKVLYVGFYWPTLFKDVHSYARKCQVCQTTAKREKKHTLPLQLVTVEGLFEKKVLGHNWGNHSQFFSTS